jgi:hypothetical protein
MHSWNRRLPWRAIVSALLAAPAVSLLAAVAVVWGAGNVLSPSLPLGMHTLVPVALLLPMPVLVVVALAGLVLAGLAQACPRGRADEPIGAVQGAVLLFAAQAVFLAAQLVFVWQVNGIPDAALSLLAAAVLQAIVLAVATGAAVAVGMVIAAVPARVRGSSWLAFSARRGTLLPVFVNSPVYRLGTRRGPPPFLLSD